MKTLIGFLLLTATLCAQPDCQKKYHFTNRAGDIGSYGQELVPLGSASSDYNNTQGGCTAWAFSYNAEGVSALSISLQDAPMAYSSGFTPSTYVTFAGTSVAGSNPMSNTTSGLYLASGFYPWIRVNSVSFTGTGSVDVVLSGWKSTAMLGSIIINGTNCYLSGSCTVTAAASDKFVVYCPSASGSTTTYSCTPSPALTSYTNSIIVWVPDVLQAGSTPTLNVSGLGAVAIKNADLTSPLTNTFFANGVYLLAYNGTNLILVSGSNLLTNQFSGVKSNGYGFFRGLQAGYSAVDFSGSVAAALTIASASSDGTIPFFACIVGTSTDKTCHGVAAAVWCWTLSATDASTTCDTGQSRIGAGIVGAGNGTQGDLTGSYQAAKYLTATNCANVASPSVCGTASSGSTTIAASATTKVINTSAVTATSQINITEDMSLGSALSVTCNTQSLLIVGTPRVIARSAGVSFTIGVDVAPTANPICINYTIIN